MPEDTSPLQTVEPITEKKTTGPANVPGGVMNLEPGTIPGKIVEGTPLSGWPEKEDANARARLRAFEDEHFGEKCVRINGAIEKGSGSPYSEMKPEQKAQYAALERLVAAEDGLAAARAALAVAENEHAAAEAAVNA